LRTEQPPYGLGDSGIVGTPESLGLGDSGIVGTPESLGRGDSGIVGTPESFGRGELGMVGTPLANEIAKFAAPTAMIVMARARTRFILCDIGCLPLLLHATTRRVAVFYRNSR
jgi:hypothetical protein